MPDTSPIEGQTQLKQFIEAESDQLLHTLRYYVWRAGLAHQGTDAQGLAAELLNDVTVEALEHADRFRPSGQPFAWLLGIAANLIKRKQVKQAKQAHREPLIHDLYPHSETAVSEDELFDWLTTWSTPGPADQVEANDAAATILALLSPSDQRIIQLAILLELDGKALARALNLKPGTARMQLHRALNRLRHAWHQRQMEDVNNG